MYTTKHHWQAYMYKIWDMNIKSYAVFAVQLHWAEGLFWESYVLSKSSIIERSWSSLKYPSYSWCDVGGSTADTVPVPFSLFSAAGIQEVSVHLTFPSVQAPLWTLISHLTFLFSLSTKLWNFVKWDDPGDVTMPTCHLAVCHLSAQEGKASTENREKGKNKWKWVKQRGRVHGNMCVFLSVTTCVCLCLSLCVRASGGLLALG